MLKVDFSDHFRIFFSQDPVFVIKREIKLFTLSLKEKYLKLTGDSQILLKIQMELIKHFYLYLVTFVKSHSKN